MAFKVIQIIQFKQENKLSSQIAYNNKNKNKMAN